MMKINLKIVYLLLIFFAVSCTNEESRRYQELEKEWDVPNGKIKVLSTTAMINELVKEIGGDDVDSITLIKGDLDPHSYQLVKGDDEKLNKSKDITTKKCPNFHIQSLKLRNFTKAKN